MREAKLRISSAWIEDIDYAATTGHRALYRRMPRLLEELALAHADGTYTRLLGRLAKVDVIDARRLGPGAWHKVTRGPPAFSGETSRKRSARRSWRSLRRSGTRLADQEPMSRSTLNPLLLVLFTLASAACGASPDSGSQQKDPIREPVKIAEPPATASSSAPFHLYMSNQSRELDPVDVDVSIDGTLVIQGDLTLGNSHKFHQFDFNLSPGEHVIHVKSTVGGVYDVRFVTDGEKWGTVDFYYCEGGCSEPYKKQFVWNLSSSQIGFM